MMEDNKQGLQTQTGEKIVLITDQILNISSDYMAVLSAGPAECSSLITYRGRLCCISRSNTEGYMDWKTDKVHQWNGKTSILIFEDNQSCIKMLKSDTWSQHTKHTETKYYFICNSNKSGNLMSNIVQVIKWSQTCWQNPSRLRSKENLLKELDISVTVKSGGLVQCC